jgi:predicted metal-dependent hydrolase
MKLKGSIGKAMSENQLLARIRRDARRIAKRFNLKYLDVITEPPEVRDRYGSCDGDRVIRIRLHKLRDGRFMKYWNLVNTLCHEMAHLKYMNHGKDFKQLYFDILSWARDRQIYVPNS